jgi:nucleoside-diphosphate-sugar epimerase
MKGGWTVATVLVTGVLGCIGSWVAYHLSEEGHRVVGIDLADDTYRIKMLGIEGSIQLHRLDICDSSALQALIEVERPDAVIHLAGMLIPACRANPRRAIEVNVGAFAALLDLARVHGFSLSYASSSAVLGPDLGYPLAEDQGLRPGTLYGVFKRADEEIARLYAQDWGLPSTGLRPNVVYGPGRDGGMSADINLALWHAWRGEPYHVRFGGTIPMQSAPEVARMFVQTALHPFKMVMVYNLPSTVAEIGEVAGLIESVTGSHGMITWDPDPFAVAWNQDVSAFQRDYGPWDITKLETGFRETLEVWRRAGERGLVPRP